MEASIGQQQQANPSTIELESHANRQQEVRGTIRINPRCYTDAFIEDPEGGPDIYLEGSKSRGPSLEGDLVLVRINLPHKWKPVPLKKDTFQKTGVVIEVIKRNHPGLAGGFLKKYSPNQAQFSPTDSRVPRMLIDISSCPLDFVSQPDRYKDVLFVAQLQDWNQDETYASGTLVRIVGDCNVVESKMEAILMENQIFDVDFPPEAYKELEYLENLPVDWFEKNSQGRRDLTNECVFTIDPKTARDLDDALSIKQIAEQIYEIGVHIADVSYFVPELSAVDYYARQRTTSVYLVDRVIPMLPRPLCEHMCSLNPNEPKLTFSVIWKMDKYGRIIDEWFGRTVIKSCVKLAYEQAQDMIDRPDDISWIEEGANMPKLYNFDWTRISKSVNLLNKIAQNIRAKRFEDGALKIDNVKIKFELDKETGVPAGFAFERRTDANFLIEEFMLQANMSVARKIYKFSNELAFLRRHPPSNLKVLLEVKEFCEAKGYLLDVTSAGSIQKSLNSIKDSTMAKVVSFFLLRAMKNAEYICAGSVAKADGMYNHFALNCPFYTHFTSPIRRYPDVIVHRQLAMALNYQKETNEDLKSLTMMAAESTKRKIAAKLISETSQKLFFNLFVQKAGFCELLACVTRIFDQSFEVILIDYNQAGRIYMNSLKKQLIDYKSESSEGVRRLILKWKPMSKRSKRSVARKEKFKEKDNGELDSDQVTYRRNLEDKKSICTKNSKFKINESIPDQEQIIQMFDVIRVIVTVDPKDVAKLEINLKSPV